MVIDTVNPASISFLNSRRFLGSDKLFNMFILVWSFISLPMSLKSRLLVRRRQSEPRFRGSPSSVVQRDALVSATPFFLICIHLDIEAVYPPVCHTGLR